MPRGWLKHNRSVGNKASLGGSSKRQGRSRRTHGGRLTNDPSFANTLTRNRGRNYSHKATRTGRIDTDYDDHYDYHNFDEEDVLFDEVFDTKNTTFIEVKGAMDESETFQDVVDHRMNVHSIHIDIGSSITAEPLQKEQQQCPICCEERPLIALMRECNHPPTCYHCLRQIYVVQAQQSVNNYPLKCYHPSCNKDVRDTQLTKHKLVLTEKELQKHYRLTTFAKVYKKSQLYKVVHCPDCDTPRAVKTQELTACRNCGSKFVVAHDGVTTEITTIAVLRSLGHDEKGANDGFARCPRCRIFISKGEGCDHMMCACGWHFSWSEALRRVKKCDFKIAKATNKLILDS